MIVNDVVNIFSMKNRRALIHGIVDLRFTIFTKAATILRLLGNETIHFNTRGKKSELNIEVKSTTKFKFFFFKYINIFIYFTIIRRFRFSILYFNYLQT